jgi:DNA-binding beta-propeller fold protein YncE
MWNIPVLLLASSLALAASPRFHAEPYAGSTWVGDGGLSRDSLLLQAEGIAAGRDGSVYISDAQTHRIRRITPAGTIETIAGTGVSGLSGDGGPAIEAQLSAPYGLALDASSNLFIADLGNRRIRRIATNGTISTVATGFTSPRNVAVDLAGNLYVADFDASRVYRVTPAGSTSVLIGPDTLDHPAGLAVDRAGALYIGDTGHHTVWKWQNGSLSPAAAALSPTGLAFDALNRLLIADPGGAAGTLVARDVATAPNGTIFTTDGRLVRRILTGLTTVIAGRGDSARGIPAPPSRPA